MPTDEEADLDNVAAEVQEDIDKGEGAKHFQDALDDMSSTFGSARVELEPDELEAEKRWMRALSAGIAEQLAGQDFSSLRMNRDGHGTGYVLVIRDAQRREYTVEYSYEDGIKAGIQYGEQMGRVVMHQLCERILEAREHYFRRMGLGGNAVLKLEGLH